jgi:hypothetical protein
MERSKSVGKEVRYYEGRSGDLPPKRAGRQAPSRLPVGVAIGRSQARQPCRFHMQVSMAPQHRALSPAFSDKEVFPSVHFQS